MAMSEEMDKRLQNLEQGQAEMRETLQRLAEEQLEGEQPSDYEVRKYDWGEEFNISAYRLSDYFSSSLHNFSRKHMWMHQILLPGIDKSLYDALKDLWDVYVRFFLARKVTKDLSGIIGVKKEPDGDWSYYFSGRELKKIIREQKLNSEQEKEFEELTFKKTDLLSKYYWKIREAMPILYRYSGSYKAFWMEANFNDFVQVMIVGMEKEVDKAVEAEEDDLEKFIEGSISYELWENGVQLSKDEKLKKISERGEERKVLIGEVFVEFEEDLRSVQKDVMTYLEASKHWWEKWWVQWVLIAVAGLSGISSLFTIGVWFIPIGTVIVVVWLVVDIIRMRKKSDGRKWFKSLFG